ncbi:MAG: STAS domain-containing protein [Burkholderiaceae bacterium]|nr:STAS domain-containing protein [Burkholderiaceae bacterium]
MAEIDLQLHHLGDGLDQIRIVGRLDSAGAQALEQPLKAMIAAAPARVLIDLSQVPFLGSMGIRSLLTSAQAMRRRGGALGLLNPQSLVDEVLKMTGIQTLIPTFHDVEAARSALAEHVGGP